MEIYAPGTTYYVAGLNSYGNPRISRRMVSSVQVTGPEPQYYYEAIAGSESPESEPMFLNIQAAVESLNAAAEQKYKETLQVINEQAIKAAEQGDEAK